MYNEKYINCCKAEIDGLQNFLDENDGKRIPCVTPWKRHKYDDDGVCMRATPPPDCYRLQYTQRAP